jgi:hypothetical protein
MRKLFGQQEELKKLPKHMTVNLEEEDPTIPEAGEKRESSSEEEVLESLEMPELPTSVWEALGTESVRGTWVDQYTEAVAKLTPRTPEYYHEAAALWAVSTLVARRVVVPKSVTGFDNVYPNLYILLLAPSGQFRKTTAITPTAELAYSLFPERMLTRLATPEGLLDELAGKDPSNYKDLSERDQAIWDARKNNPAQKGLLIDEFGVFMDFAGKDYNAGLVGLFMRLYDCPELDDRHTRKDGVLVIHDAYMSILGATTPSSIGESLGTTKAWANGWWARFAILTPNTEKEWARPMGFEGLPQHIWDGLQEVREQLPPMGTHITLQAAFEDEATTDAFWKYAEVVDTKLLPNLADIGTERFESSYSRLPATVLKVATLFATLEYHKGKDLVEIRLPHLRRAVEVVESWRQSLHRVFRYQTQEDRVTLPDRILKRLAKVQSKGATCRDLYRVLNSTQQDVQRELDTMLQNKEVVTRENSKTVLYYLPEYAPQE